MPGAGSRPGSRLVSRLVSGLRNGWNQLTSMRTALVLLFLLALAAIPGSVLPQRGVSIESVRDFYQENPDLAPLVDRLGGFNVYGSPWFAAIYLLLFVSLVGCIVPRLVEHVRALRARPVDAPRRLSRLPHHADALVHADRPAAAGAVLHRALRGARWRSVVREQADGTVTVSAEKGYLKETGNLLMHTAMVVVLAGLAFGSGFGWHGNRLVVAGPETGFCNSLQQYDEFGLGSRVDQRNLPDFCLTLTDFTAEFTRDGLATAFLAQAEVAQGGGPARPAEFTVNSPLRLSGASVYLLGNGYAPVLRYTDRFGQAQTVTAPFLPIDQRGTAEGLAAFPDANVDPAGQPDRTLQVAFEGLYLPTAPDGMLVQSAHPAEQDPVLLLFAYRGDLGLDDGVARSVWTLDPAQLDRGVLAQVGDPQFLAPGETMTLDDGTTVEFLGTQPWIAVSVRHDPGEPVALTGVGLLLIGLVLSLAGRRRRLWFRLSPQGPGSLVEAGLLPRTDYPGHTRELGDLLTRLPLTRSPAADSSTSPTGTEPVPASRST